NFRRLAVVHRHDHGSKERRLRAGEHITAVGVEESAVVTDFEEEILHHAARHPDSTGLQQATNDEVAVPAVHLVEHAAGYDVRMRKIKQGMGIEALDVDFSQLMNYLREVRDLGVALA